MKEIVVAGGGPAGLTAALYAARAGKHVRVLEQENPGGQIVYAPRVENYPGLPGMSGMDLARRLRAAGSRLEIVFITSHFEFVGEGYEVDARHYLVKPVAGEKLCTVLSRAAERLAEEPPYVVFSCEGETVKLYEAEVLYAESFLHDLVIHARTGEYRIRETISSFAQRLSEDFFQTHRSYLVNLRAIVRIGRTSVTLENGAALPLARGKYDAVNRAFIARM